MLAISLDTAKNLAIGGTAAFLVASVASAWIMKTIIQKLAVAVLLALLAFGVWSQRDALQHCANDVKTDFEEARANPDQNVADIETECKFFGTTITVKDPRNDDTE